MRIAVVDYGMGNLASVRRAVNYCGYDCEVTNSPEVIQSSDMVIIPGVGAIADAMKNLEASGLTSVIRETLLSGKKVLCICLGLQMLFDFSDEPGFDGGPVNGLGVLKGKVVKFPEIPGIKVPHMGWNELEPTDVNKGWFNRGDFAYFVHSYFVVPEDESLVCAYCEHGVRFAAAVSWDNVLAVQFHPEKSGEWGLGILKKWIEGSIDR